MALRETIAIFTFFYGQKMELTDLSKKYLAASRFKHRPLLTSNQLEAQFGFCYLETFQ